jgi:2'-hydroxyisoflavone reductase
MKVLVLGGTVFLGRHITEVLLQRGHDITLFNRGEHNPDLFPDVEKLRGNRDGGLDPLRDRTWDAVVDTCGYVPRVVRASAELLHQHVDRYVFVSTLSVFASEGTVGQDESAPVGTLDDPSVEEITGETYGPLKALCEQVVLDIYGERALVIRPGLIVGRYDKTDRFTYWPHRIAQGGRILAPSCPDRPVQIIDVRDLAEWTITAVEAGTGGLFNATGPAHVLTMGEVLAACVRVTAADSDLVWVPDQFLLDQGVQPWTDLPLWIPDADDMKGFMSVDCSRAINAGLTFRDIDEIVRDTVQWDRTLPEERELVAGISREREGEILAAWDAVSG